MRLDDIVLPSADWEFDGEDANSRSWFGPTRVAIRIFLLDGPGPVPMDLDSARVRYEADSQSNGGVLLELEEVQTRMGPVLRSVFKYHLPQYGPGMCYVGILLQVFGDEHLRLHTEAIERPPTGAREVAVMVIDPESWPELKREPVPYDPETARTVDVRRLPSDDPKYDEMFPSHPLSRVRAQQRDILADLDLARGEA